MREGSQGAVLEGGRGGGRRKRDERKEERSTHPTKEPRYGIRPIKTGALAPNDGS